MGNAGASASRNPFCCSWDSVCKVLLEAVVSAWGGRPSYTCFSPCPYSLSFWRHSPNVFWVLRLLTQGRCSLGAQGRGDWVFSLGSSVCPAVSCCLSPFSSTTHFSTPFFSLNLFPGHQPPSELPTVHSSISPPIPHFFLILPLELVQSLGNVIMQQLVIS